jgi:hypothetical protein
LVRVKGKTEKRDKMANGSAARCSSTQKPRHGGRCR